MISSPSGFSFASTQLIGHKLIAHMFKLAIVVKVDVLCALQRAGKLFTHELEVQQNPGLVFKRADPVAGIRQQRVFLDWSLGGALRRVGIRLRRGLSDCSRQ